jgi:hypothetical protein
MPRLEMQGAVRNLGAFDFERGKKVDAGTGATLARITR